MVGSESLANLQRLQRIVVCPQHHFELFNFFNYTNYFSLFGQNMALRRIQFLVATFLCLMILRTEAQRPQLLLCDFDCVEVETADIACDTALCQPEGSLDREALCSAKCIEAVINLVAEGSSCGSEKTANAFDNAIDALRDIVSSKCIAQSTQTNLTNVICGIQLSVWSTTTPSDPKCQKISTMT